MGFHEVSYFYMCCSPLIKSLQMHLALKVNKWIFKMKVIIVKLISHIRKFRVKGSFVSCLRSCLKTMAESACESCTLVLVESLYTPNHCIDSSAFHDSFRPIRLMAEVHRRLVWWFGLYSTSGLKTEKDAKACEI